MQPCLNCSKLLVNSGVARVIFRNEYIGEAMELVEELGLKIERYEP
jgi:deoxycytidylate deaminase